MVTSAPAVVESPHVIPNVAHVYLSVKFSVQYA